MNEGKKKEGKKGHASQPWLRDSDWIACAGHPRRSDHDDFASHLVDPSVTRWYHCVTRCVRRAFLLGEEGCDRKGWIERRLEELSEIFAVAVAGFAILDNHLHLLVRLDPDVAKSGRIKRGSGSVRSRIAGGWIRHAKG